MIDVRHITKRFGPAVAVNNVTFSVASGEVVGFLGPNGAGKSTTMKCITCYLAPDQGTIKVNGFDVFKQPLQVRRQIGYLPESNPLYYEMGVTDYLGFVADVHDVPVNERKRRIESIIDRVGLTRMRHKDIGELSKGYKQRVGLAQAMVADPPVLILDEPTTGLDPNQIVEIRALIRELGQEKSVILSTHILPEVRVTCSRIIIIAEGRVVDEGTPEDLIDRAKGEQIYTVTFVTPDGDAVDRALAEHPLIASYRLLELPVPEAAKAAAATTGEAPALAGEEAELAAANGESDPDTHTADESAPLVPVSQPASGGALAVAGPSDRQRYEIIASGTDDIGMDLFEMAVRHGWRLSELTRKEVSLEQVFQKLTIKETTSHAA
ncbi:MAG: Vitamin B12 import ATP-binding protein BtuD [bacterium]|nr:Vitamin B12 import ATP-binding protein BtuD [bacterium]